MTATAQRPAKQIMTMGPLVAEWIEENCVHTKGRWIGMPFALTGWERETLNELFEMVEHDGEWQRRIREAMIVIPKKNGKTEFVAALALWVIHEDPEPAPEVYCAANSEEQADLVFGAAKTMCEMSPTLRRSTEVFKDTIFVPLRPGALLRRVAAATGTNDGKNVYWAIFDELHEFTETKGRPMFTILTNGQAARQQPMTISISTADDGDDSSIFGQKFNFGQRVATGEIRDSSFLFKYWHAPEELDWRTEEAWQAANPSYGVTVMPDFYRDKVREIAQGNMRVETFERYFLNRRRQLEGAWISAEAWNACDIGPFEFDRTEPVWTGTDTSISHDASATVTAQWNPENGKLRLKARIWERPFNPHTGELVDGWHVPTIEVENHLRTVHRTYPAWAMGGDPAYFLSSLQVLEAEGLPILEFPQSDARMVPACQSLYELIINGQVEHDGDLAFKRHIEAAVAVAARSGEGGWRIKKGKSKKKIDAAVAAAIAANLAINRTQVEEEEGPSVYESRGMRVL